MAKPLFHLTSCTDSRQIVLTKMSSQLQNRRESLSMLWLPLQQLAVTSSLKWGLRCTAHHTAPLFYDQAITHHNHHPLLAHTVRKLMHKSSCETLWQCSFGWWQHKYVSWIKKQVIPGNGILTTSIIHGVEMSGRHLGNSADVYVLKPIPLYQRTKTKQLVAFGGMWK